MYTCLVCAKEFEYKSRYDIHMKNKKCSQGITPEQAKNYKCTICNKEYSSKFNLNRHMDTICKKNQNNNIQVENLNGDNNIVGNTNNINNINININVSPEFIRPFGLEDITFLSQDEMLEILLSNDPELCLLNKLTKNKENINFFHFL